MRYVVHVLMLFVYYLLGVCSVSSADDLISHTNAPVVEKDVLQPEVEVPTGTTTKDISTISRDSAGSIAPGADVSCSPGVTSHCEDADKAASANQLQAGSPSITSVEPSVDNQLNRESGDGTNVCAGGTVTTGNGSDINGKCKELKSKTNVPAEKPVAEQEAITDMTPGKPLRTVGTLDTMGASLIQNKLNESQPNAESRAGERAEAHESRHGHTSRLTLPTDDHSHTANAGNKHTSADALRETERPPATHSHTVLQSINRTTPNTQTHTSGPQQTGSSYNMITKSELQGKSTDKAEKSHLIHKSANVEKSTDTHITATITEPIDTIPVTVKSPEVLTPTQTAAQALHPKESSSGTHNTLDTTPPPTIEEGVTYRVDTKRTSTGVPTSLSTVPNALPFHHSVDKTDGILGSTSLLALAALATLAVAAAALAH